MKIKILAYTFLGGRKEYRKEFKDKSDLDKHISIITNENSLFRDVQYTYKNKDYRVFNKKRSDGDYVSKYRKTQANIKTKLFKTSRPKSALMINEACEKGFFILEKTSNDQRKKFIKPTGSFMKEFEDYLKRLREISI